MFTLATPEVEPEVEPEWSPDIPFHDSPLLNSTDSIDQTIEGTKHITAELGPIQQIVVKGSPSLTRSTKQPQTKHISAELDPVDTNNSDTDPNDYSPKTIKGIEFLQHNVN